MYKKIRVAIIGLGVVGQRLIKDFNENQHTVITTVCDLDETLAQNIATANGDVTYYTDYKTLLEAEDVDLVYVSVPPALHFDIVMEAIRHNRHVLCEKPLANSIEEAETMWKAAEEANVVHAMHFPLPYSAPVRTIQELVEEQALGEIRRISLQLHFDVWPRPWQQTPWIGTREQGGFIREILPHYAQLILQFFGPVQTVHSKVEFPENQSISETGLIAHLTLENGIEVLIDGLVGQAEKEKIRFTIHGTQQSISLEDWRVLKSAKRGENIVEVDQSQIKPSSVNLIEECVKAISGQKAFLIDFKMGYAVQKILEETRGATL